MDVLGRLVGAVASVPKAGKQLLRSRVEVKREAVPELPSVGHNEWAELGAVVNKGALVAASGVLRTGVFLGTHPLAVMGAVAGAWAVKSLVGGVMAYRESSKRMLPALAEPAAEAEMEAMDDVPVPLDLAPGPVRVEEEVFLPALDADGAVIPADAHGVQEEVRRRRVRHVNPRRAWHHIRDMVVGQVSFLEDNPANRLVITRLVLNAMREHGMRPTDITRHHQAVVELCFVPPRVVLRQRQSGYTAAYKSRREQFFTPWGRRENMILFLAKYILGLHRPSVGGPNQD